MAVAGPIQFVDITGNRDIPGNRFAAIPNPSLTNKDGTKKTMLDHLITYLNTTNGGAFRLFQLLDKVTRATVLVLKDFGSTLAGYYEGLAGKFSMVWAMMTIPRLPDVTKAAYKAVTDWSKPPEGAVPNAEIDKAQRAHDVFDAIAAWFYAGSLFVASPALKNVGDVSSLGADINDLVGAIDLSNNAGNHLEYVQKQSPENTDVQARFVETKRYALIKMIKAIASVVGGVLGLLVLAFGGPVLPAVVLLGISLTSTVAAVASHFYKETCRFDIVNFHAIRQPELLVAGVNSY